MIHNWKVRFATFMIFLATVNVCNSLRLIDVLSPTKCLNENTYSLQMNRRLTMITFEDDLCTWIPFIPVQNYVVTLLFCILHSVWQLLLFFILNTFEGFMVASGFHQNAQRISHVCPPEWKNALHMCNWRMVSRAAVHCGSFWHNGAHLPNPRW